VFYFYFLSSWVSRRIANKENGSGYEARIVERHSVTKKTNSVTEYRIPPTAGYAFPYFDQLRSAIITLRAATP
jgi:hypothetical protein